MLVYDQKVPRNFWRIAIETGVLTSTDSKIKEQEWKTQKPIQSSNVPSIDSSQLKNEYDTNQTDKGKEQNLRREAVLIGKLTRKYEC